MDLQDFRKDLIEEAKAAAAADGSGTSAAFAEIVARYMMDAEVLPDFTPAFYAGETRKRGRIRVDGYTLDEIDGTMNLVVVNYSGSDEARTLIRTDAQSVFNWPVRFVEETLHNDLHLNIEISTPAADLADLLRENSQRIRKYRLILLTDSVMSGRIDTLDVRDIDGVPVECQIWDVGRLYNVCVQTGTEHVEIDFTEFAPNGLPCLEASDAANPDYRCFLCVIPGEVLANIYDRWGGQLLEGNVRSFLSTKVAVNKKIRETILRQPTKFFAFNNGVSATALGVQVESRPEGKFITYAQDFQIINGGQTTASLSNARHKDKAILGDIMVQMKLTELTTPDVAQELVPEIARSSNSQNKVSDADFFSTHPFHVRMEQISRRLFAPAVGGAQYETHWFYERARGQYLQSQMRMTPSERKKFETQNPKGQLITKTDLAKVQSTWRGLPHVVSKGAQTNFVEFANWIDKQWSESEANFNEKFYRESVALFILFKHVEKLVTHQPWYQNGYRANIVTYSIALLGQLIKKQFPGRALDLNKIWSHQEVPEVLTSALVPLTKAVMESITDDSRGTVNVTQWCKRDQCWDRIQKLPIHLPTAIESALEGVEAIREERRQAKKDQEEITGIGFQVDVVNRGAEYWKKLARFLVEKKLVSPTDHKTLLIACQMPAKIPSEHQSKQLLALVKRANAEGYTA